MNVCIDTSVCLRFLVGDDPQKLASSRQLFESVAQGKIRLYIPSIVLLEIYWVLTSLYKYTKQYVHDALGKMMGMRGLVILETTDFRAAFSIHKKTGVKLADCLIATQMRKGIVLCTYDTDFRKIPKFAVVEPADVMRKLNMQRVRS